MRLRYAMKALGSAKSVGCPSWGAAVSFSHRPLNERDGATGEKGSAPGGASDAPPAES
jgi:hypothetical protein